jgi:hypothetical protein
MYSISTHFDPLHYRENNPALLTWRANFFARGDEYPSTLSLVCQHLPHPLAFAPLTLSHPTVQITQFT